MLSVVEDTLQRDAALKLVEVLSANNATLTDAVDELEAERAAFERVVEEDRRRRSAIDNRL